MDKVAIYLHFSEAQWPIVNKMSGIAKSLNVFMQHCSSLEKLKETLKHSQAERVLFFTDDGMLDFVKNIKASDYKFSLQVAMFTKMKIADFSKSIVDSEVITYLMEYDNYDSYGRHLSILVKKFRDQDILDLEKYLSFGASITSFSIDSNVTKKIAIDKIHHFVSNLGDPGYNHPFEEYARRITEMADELLINSIFAANPRLRGQDRSKPFTLTDAEIVDFTWGYDGEYFGLSVRDPFGEFTKNTIMKYVSDQASKDKIVNSVSAGLGLKLIFDQSHQIITNVKTMQVTEVIIIVKFEDRLRDFEKSKKSFFYFSESGEKENKN